MQNADAEPGRRVSLDPRRLCGALVVPVERSHAWMTDTCAPGNRLRRPSTAIASSAGGDGLDQVADFGVIAEVAGKVGLRDDAHEVVAIDYR